MKAFVIGNGESRLGLNLDNLNGETFGCNALYRDFTPDKLIAVAYKMAEEVIADEHEVYTRRRYLKQLDSALAKPIPFTGSQTWDSGSVATLMAAQSDATDITLIGFDLLRMSKSVNNIYKGTANYQPANSARVDPTRWINELHAVFNHYQDKTFNILTDAECTMPLSWKRLENVNIMDFSRAHNIH